MSNCFASCFHSSVCVMWFDVLAAAGLLRYFSSELSSQIFLQVKCDLESIFQVIKSVSQLFFSYFTSKIRFGCCQNYDEDLQQSDFQFLTIKFLHILCHSYRYLPQNSQLFTEAVYIVWWHVFLLHPCFHLMHVASFIFLSMQPIFSCLLRQYSIYTFARLTSFTLANLTHHSLDRSHQPKYSPIGEI